MSKELFEKAVRSADPAGNLRRAVENLITTGVDREELSRRLEAFLQELRDSPDTSEEQEDAVSDVIDAVTGWCHPSARLFP